jgi:hypothetical protein
MSPLSPQVVYNALLSAGASTIQAIGIMANAINESGFDPEAIGDNGTSFGLVQQHGNYGYLVTGNDTADLNAQIALLKQNGGFSAASGASAAEAASNFAANYEKCVGCQAGGAQNTSRTNNAATVLGWVNSGKWPQSAGSPSSGGGSTGQSATLLGFPGGSFDPLNWPSEIAGAAEQGILGSAESALSGIASKVKTDIWNHVRDWLIRLGLIIFGAFIVYAGINGLMKSSSDTTDLVSGGVTEAAKHVPAELP